MSFLSKNEFITVSNVEFPLKRWVYLCLQFWIPPRRCDCLCLQWGVSFKCMNVTLFAMLDFLSKDEFTSTRNYVWVSIERTRLPLFARLNFAMLSFLWNDDFCRGSYGRPHLCIPTASLYLYTKYCKYFLWEQFRVCNIEFSLRLPLSAMMSSSKKMGYLRLQRWVSSKRMSLPSTAMFNCL
jgi:hypothetical protein